MKQISLSAKIYANSLIKTDLSPDTVLENLNFVCDIMRKSSDFSQTMLNPAISDCIKIEIFDEIFRDNLDEKIKNFIKILIKKNKFAILEQIINAYTDELDKINKVQKAEIISAIELKEDQKRQIIEKLTNKLNKNIAPNWIINEEIIAGLVIKYDNKIIDSSLKTKLNKFNKKQR